MDDSKEVLFSAFKSYTMNLFITGVKVKFFGDSLGNKDIELRRGPENYLLKRDSDNKTGRLKRGEFICNYDEYGITDSYYEWFFVEENTKEHLEVDFSEIYTVLTPISYQQF